MNKQTAISVVIPYLDYDQAQQIERIIFSECRLGFEVILTPGYAGKGDALLNGSLNSHGDIIIWLDADMQIHPRQINTMLNYLELSNAEAVYGNKYHAHSITHYKPLRRLVSFSYNLFVRHLFGISLRDTQCGIKAFRRQALIKALKKVDTKGYGFDLEVYVALQEIDAMIVDAPVIVKAQEGPGSVSLKSVWTTFWETMRIWWKKNRGYYRRER